MIQLAIDKRISHLTIGDCSDVMHVIIAFNALFLHLDLEDHRDKIYS